MKSGNRLFLFKILPFLRSLIWEKTIIDLGHARWCLNKWHLTAVCPIQAGTETGSYGPNSHPAPENWERMALRNPLDNGGLFTVTKCKTDLALSFALWNIHHHQIPVRGETLQSCKPILPLEQFGSWIQLGGHSLVFIGTLSLLWLTESKDRGEIFLLITIRSLKMLLTQIILAASLYFCVEKKHENVHLTLLLWISFLRVSLLLWQ